MVWNRRRAAALAACAWSRVTDGIPHDGADPRLRQERRLEALQDRMDWVGEREPEPVRGTRIAAGEQQRDRLYVPIDAQRSAVAAVAEGVCADALDLHLPEGIGTHSFSDCGDSGSLIECVPIPSISTCPSNRRLRSRA